MRRHPWLRYLAVLLLIGVAGCDRPSAVAPARRSELADDNTPTFTLAWSNYPSWSVFGAADELEFIDGSAGRVGPLEKQLRVDIAMQQSSYDESLNMFQAGMCDAACMTNVDALIVSNTRDSVAILPTSSRNRFGVNALGDRSDIHSLVHDEEQPGAIIDMVVVGQDALERPGADRFVRLLTAMFYQVNEELRGDQGEKVLAALSAKSPGLDVDEVREAFEQTEFIETPEAAKDLLDSQSFREAMQTVEQVCVDKNLVKDPSVEYGRAEKGGQLRFDPSFLETGD